MRSFRWVIIALTFVATVFNYLDRSALAYAIKPLQDQFHLNNTDFGVIAAAFGAGYLLMTVIGGILVDRYGSRLVWSISSFLWSLACALIGAARGFITLFLFRVILGIAEGPSFPAMTRVVTNWLPVRERGRSLGFGLSAVPFASVVGAPLITTLLDCLGWRGMFFALGILGILWSVSWYTLYRDHPNQSSHVESIEQSMIDQEVDVFSLKKKTSWRFILKNPTLIVNNYAFFCFGYLLFFAITWLPGYLEQIYAVNIKTIGWFLVVPWLLATILIILAGFLSDYLWRKTHSLRYSRSYVIGVCQLLSGIMFIPMIFTHSLWVAMASITLALAFGLMPNACFYALNADLTQDKAATSLGIMDAGFALSGILSPILTGWLSTITGNFVAPITLLMLFTLSSSLAIFLAQHPDRDRLALE